MARIRSVKPELQQSEKLGRVSRDARLTFILLFPQCDDEGRCRANSRMLASLLYPYDDDAPALINGWLDELEHEGCVRRYVIDGNHYIDIPNFLEHQKIDHPKASKLPAYRDDSRLVANVRESSPRIKDQGRDQGEDQGGERTAHAAPVLEVVRSDSVDEATRAYNDLAERIDMPRCQKLSSSRRTRLLARLQDCGGLDGWDAALAKLEMSSFCRGKNDRGWKADFDFLCQDKTFTRLMEGFYDDRNKPQDRTAADRAILAGAFGLGEMGSVAPAA